MNEDMFEDHDDDEEEEGQDPFEHGPLGSTRAAFESDPDDDEEVPMDPPGADREERHGDY